MPRHAGAIPGEAPEAILASMAESLSLTAVYETVENGWVHARIAEIPGVITAAPNRARAEEMLLDALREYVLSFTEPGRAEGGPNAASDSTTVEVTFSTAAA